MDDESTARIIEAEEESEASGTPQLFAVVRSSSGTAGLIHNEAGAGAEVPVEIKGAGCTIGVMACGAQEISKAAIRRMGNIFFTGKLFGFEIEARQCERGQRIFVDRHAQPRAARHIDRAVSIDGKTLVRDVTLIITIGRRNVAGQSEAWQ